MLEVRDVSYAYPGQAGKMLRGVSFSLQPGEKVVLLGANGSGKSTLLKVLNGLLFPTSGGVYYQGVAVTAKSLKDREFGRRFRREVALLFQQPDSMLFNPTVHDEIAFGPRQLGDPDPDATARLWAERLGLSQYLDRPPFRLSGGEKQKLCLAALLAMQPQVLLLDEPAANLDPRSVGWLVEFLRGLPIATIITTHNLPLAAEFGDRGLLLSERHELAYDGKLADLLQDAEALVAANLLYVPARR